MTAVSNPNSRPPNAAMIVLPRRYDFLPIGVRLARRELAGLPSLAMVESLKANFNLANWASSGWATDESRHFPAFQRACVVWDRYSTPLFACRRRVNYDLGYPSPLSRECDFFESY
jgi:hypothetical protein